MGEVWKQLMLHPGYCDGELAEVPFTGDVLLTGAFGSGVSNTLKVLLFDLMLQNSPEDFGFAFFDGAAGSDLGTYVDRYNGDPDTPHLILEDLCDSYDHVIRSLSAILRYAEEHPNKIIAVVFNEFVKIPLDTADYEQIHDEFKKHDIMIIATTNCSTESAIKQFLEVYPCAIRISGRNAYKCVKATLDVLPDPLIQKRVGQVYVRNTGTGELLLVTVPYMDWRDHVRCMNVFMRKTHGNTNYLYKLDQEELYPMSNTRSATETPHISVEQLQDILKKEWSI